MSFRKKIAYQCRWCEVETVDLDFLLFHCIITHKNDVMGELFR